MSIKCGFRGRPEPVISWLYNGEEMTMNGSPVTGMWSSDDLERTLILLYLGGILSLNQPKEGIYQCIGRNPYGIAQASAALVLPNDAKSEGTT